MGKSTQVVRDAGVHAKVGVEAKVETERIVLYQTLETAVLPGRRMLQKHSTDVFCALAQTFAKSKLCIKLPRRRD